MCMRVCICLCARFQRHFQNLTPGIPFPRINVCLSIDSNISKGRNHMSSRGSIKII